MASRKEADPARTRAEVERPIDRDEVRRTQAARTYPKANSPHAQGADQNAAKEHERVDLGEGPREDAALALFPKEAATIYFARFPKGSELVHWTKREQREADGQKFTEWSARRVVTGQEGSSTRSQTIWWRVADRHIIHELGAESARMPRWIAAGSPWLGSRDLVSRLGAEVQTPLGKLRDCIRVHVRRSTAQILTQRRWYCQNYGLVRVDEIKGTKFRTSLVIQKIGPPPDSLRP